MRTIFNSSKAQRLSFAGNMRRWRTGAALLIGALSLICGGLTPARADIGLNVFFQSYYQGRVDISAGDGDEGQANGSGDWDDPDGFNFSAHVFVDHTGVLTYSCSAGTDYSNSGPDDVYVSTTGSYTVASSGYDSFSYNSWSLSPTSGPSWSTAYDFTDSGSFSIGSNDFSMGISGFVGDSSGIFSLSMYATAL